MPLPLDQEPKVELTAAVLIPPEGAWEPVQAIRRMHDPQFIRWMPHVTLLYPFVPEARLAEAADLLGPAAASVPALDVTLGGFGHFVHPSGSVTLWLRLEPADAVRALQAKLQAAMPWCDDVTRYSGGFTPHLSLGRFREAADASRLALKLEETWVPLRIRIGDVALIARSGAPAEPFKRRHTLPLGV
jgi:poly(A) polymerase